MVIGRQDAQRRPIEPVPDHLVETRKASAGVKKGDVHLTDSRKEAGRSGVGPRLIRGGLWGSRLKRGEILDRGVDTS